ncbi:MAG: polyprenyl synthetase family protein [Pirellulales bacterium]|nr:polyprenyl synthetase family protein [Pirellulales bacterium]
MDSTSTARPAPSVSPSAGGDTSSRPSSSTSNSAREVLARLYGPIRRQLEAVERRLGQELQSPYESLVPLLRHGTQLGGKRLRPAMLLLAAKACGRVTDDHIVLGTVIEMVHTATLIHDDVLDEASTRRHVPTVNARWDSHTSILLGDYLFAQSFRLAATLQSTEACRQIGEASRLVCEGEMRQVLQRNVFDLDEASYLEMIRGKTAELCQVACHLGAQYAGADSATIDALSRYGDAVGIAFQIADDYLDLWGNHSAVGKTLGTDVEQGKMTLPLIRLLETSDSNARQRVLTILSGPSSRRVELIRPYLEESDARQYTREKAEARRQIAMEAIEDLPSSAARSALQAIANFSVDRRF